MKVLTVGHKYELESFEGGKAQVIQFIEKEKKNSLDDRLVTVNDGTTNEEVLAVLIDRMRSLQAKHSCHENEVVIDKLEESLFWLKKRTADRKARKVEGTDAR